MTHIVQVELHDTEFVVAFGDVRLRFAPAKLASGLSDVGMLLRATQGDVTPELRTHFAEHFGQGQYGLGGCGFCKLQGKVLAAQGRRPLRAEEMRAAARAVPQGQTAWGEERNARAREAAQERRAARVPQLAGSRRSFAEVLF